jgi:hypothetical protein
MSDVWESAQKSIEQAYENGRREGYDEGYQAGLEESRKLIEQLCAAIELIINWPTRDEHGNVLSISHGLLSDTLRELLDRARSDSPPFSD